MSRMSPDGVVENLTTSCGGLGIFLPGLRLKIGAPVRMIAGPSAEQPGTIYQLDVNPHVRVILHLVEARFPVATLATDVRPLSEVRPNRVAN